MKKKKFLYMIVRELCDKGMISLPEAFVKIWTV